MDASLARELSTNMVMLTDARAKSAAVVQVPTGHHSRLKLACTFLPSLSLTIAAIVALAASPRMVRVPACLLTRN